MGSTLRVVRSIFTALPLAAFPLAAFPLAALSFAALSFAAFPLATLSLAGCQFDSSGLTPPDAAVPITCQNGIRDPGETCDGSDLGGETCIGLGYDSGDLGCTSSCTFDVSACVGAPTCGNGVIDEAEACDGSDLGEQTCASVTGLAEGELVCATDCSFDSTGCHECGNGIREEAEGCDGGDLGGLGCVDLGFDRGTLACSQGCTLDQSRCSDYPTSWLDTAWLYRKAITVPAARVTGDLPRFPLLVALVDADLQAHALPSGDDLRFTSGDGLTPIPHEMEAWDAQSGTLFAWAQVPVVRAASDTTVYLYFGNPLSGPQQNPAGVWDGSFQGVWHLSEGGAGNRIDSTSHAFHAVPAGYEGDEGALGRIHGADLMDGTNDHLALPSGVVGGLTTFTVCFWLKTTESRTNATFWHNPTLFGQVTTGYRSGDFAILTSGGAIGLWSGLCAGDDGGFLSALVVNDDAWHFVCAVNDNAHLRLSVDGGYVSETCSGGRAVDPQESWVGAHSGETFTEQGDHHQGTFDELQVSNVARPVSWISASYSNQVSPGTFFVVGPTEDILP